MLEINPELWVSLEAVFTHYLHNWLCPDWICSALTNLSKPFGDSKSTLILHTPSPTPATNDQSYMLLVIICNYIPNNNVNHFILVKILKKSGFGKQLLTWFKSYLENRHQWVKIYGFKSNTFLASFGVPQGSLVSTTVFTFCQ